MDVTDKLEMGNMKMNVFTQIRNKTTPTMRGRITPFDLSTSLEIVQQ